MDIFTTTFSGVFEDSMRAIKYKLLQKLAGDNADKFACLAPVVSGKSLQKVYEDRKAHYVCLCITLLQAGFDASVLPSCCDCNSLAGNLCQSFGEGFREIVDGIAAIPDPE